jgi:cysteine desulfurase
MKKSGVKKIYLDYAATTPIDKKVFTAMTPYFEAKFGNPGSLHSFGQEAMAAVDRAREGIAKAIGADFREITFTGSATEANNLALRGVLEFWKNTLQNQLSARSSDERQLAPSTRRSHTMGTKLDESAGAFSDQFSKISLPRILISSIEHDSVLETARDLERHGVEVIYLPVLKNGVVDLKKFKEALNDRTILVSIMQANNETGVVQPIEKILEIIRNFREELRIKNNELDQKQSYPLFHTDAVQAFQFLDCDVRNSSAISNGVDLMTLSAHKIYGPKGTGVLFVRNDGNVGSSRETRLLEPMVTGGGQEFGMRSGTENVPAIVGFYEAMKLIGVNKEKEAQRIRGLKKKLWNGILKIYPSAKINGVEDEEKALPNILNVYFPDYLAEEIMVGLDLNGVAVSSGSACSSRSTKTSHVLRAMGYDEERSKRSVRFSLGRPTSEGEIRGTLKILKEVLGRLD